MIKETIYRVKCAEVEVCEDSYTEGEGDFCNFWHEERLEGKEYHTVKELFDGISENTYLFSSNPSDYVFMEGEGRIDTDATVTVDNSLADEIDLQMWRNGDLILYNAHFLCWIEVEETVYSGDEVVSSDIRDIDETDFVGFDINFG